GQPIEQARRLAIEREITRRLTRPIRDMLEHIAGLLGSQLPPFRQHGGEGHDGPHLTLGEHAGSRRVEARPEAERYELRESLRAPEDEESERGAGRAEEKLKDSATGHPETIHNSDGPGPAPARVFHDETPATGAARYLFFLSHQARPPNPVGSRRSVSGLGIGP